MDLACCGCICDECREYKKTCEGCRAIEGKPFWLKYVNLKKCPVYSCCVDKKGLHNCGQCEKIPCNKFYECLDPAMTEEQHAETILREVETLKKYNNIK